MKLISDELYQLFLKQIIHEQTNSIAYKNISIHLDIIGLSKLSEFFKNNAQEELEHRDMLISYLSDLNIPNYIGTFDKIDIDMTSILSIVEFGLNREILTKDMINAMLVVASDNEDMLAKEFLLSFIKNQRNEIAEFQYIYDNIKDFDNDMSLIRIFDQNFGM